MKVKVVSLLMLSLLLIMGLFQVDAVGSLKPILRSITTSFHWAVKWILGAPASKSERTVLTIKPELLNPQDSPQPHVPKTSKSVSLRHTKNRAELDTPKPSSDNSALEFLIRDFSDIPQPMPSEESDTMAIQLFQEMVDSEDPVTDLFPETGWYDEDELDAYELMEVLTTDEVEIPLEDVLDSDYVDPLIDKMKTEIQERLESESPEAITDDYYSPE